MNGRQCVLRPDAGTDEPGVPDVGLSSGGTNRAQSQLETPAITGIDKDISTHLNVHLTPITNAVGYEVQTCIG